jgi:uncharacterized protein (DUF58 family)
VAAGAVVAMVAANPEQTQSLQAALLLGSLLGTGLLGAPFFRARFAVRRGIPRFATSGEPFKLTVAVTNLSSGTRAGLTYLEDLAEEPPSRGDFVARLRASGVARSFRVSDPLPEVRGARTHWAELPTLPPGGVGTARVEIVAWRRGPLTLRGGLVARTDPLGLFRAIARAPAPGTVLVLPRRYPIPQPGLPGRSHYQRGGVAMASGVGEAEEFTALRDHRRGDSLRRVHWRSAARLGKLVVKEYQDEFMVRHALVLDTHCDARRDDLFEEAVAVAASFACTIPDQESMLDLMFVGPSTVCVTSGRGVGHAEQMLEVLAAVRPRREDRVDELEGLVLRHRGALSGALLVLLHWDAPRRRLVRRLRESGLPLWVLLLLRPGEPEPDPGPPVERPERLIALRAGDIAAGLRSLARKR